MLRSPSRKRGSTRVPHCLDSRFRENDNRMLFPDPGNAQLVCSPCHKFVTTLSRRLSRSIVILLTNLGELPSEVATGHKS